MFLPFYLIITNIYGRTETIVNRSLWLCRPVSGFIPPRPTPRSLFPRTYPRQYPRQFRVKPRRARENASGRDYLLRNIGFLLKRVYAAYSAVYARVHTRVRAREGDHRGERREKAPANIRSRGRLRGECARPVTERPKVHNNRILRRGSF